MADKPDISVRIHVGHIVVEILHVSLVVRNMFMNGRNDSWAQRLTVPTVAYTDSSTRAFSRHFCSHRYPPA